MYENISSTLGQCYYFFIAGIIFGAFYELLRFLRLLIKHNAVAVFIEDVFYFAACAFISFVIALSVGIGYFRVYYIVFEALGVFLYFLTFGRLINKLLRRVVKVIKKLFFGLYKKIKPKITAFFVPIAVKIKALFVKIAENMPKIEFYHQKGLKTTNKVVYNNKVPLSEGGESSGVIKAQVRKKA